MAVQYPRPDDERGTAGVTLSVPAGRYRPDQPAFSVRTSGAGESFAIKAFDADGTPRKPNPSEILLLQEEAFHLLENGQLTPVQRQQVIRAFDMISLLFGQTTPNKGAYTASQLGGFRANPQELGRAEPLNLKPMDNVYFRARQPKFVVPPARLLPEL